MLFLRSHRHTFPRISKGGGGNAPSPPLAWPRGGHTLFKGGGGAVKYPASDRVSLEPIIEPVKDSARVSDRGCDREIDREIDRSSDITGDRASDRYSDRELQ